MSDKFYPDKVMTLEEKAKYRQSKKFKKEHSKRMKAAYEKHNQDKIDSKKEERRKEVTNRAVKRYKEKIQAEAHNPGPGRPAKEYVPERVSGREGLLVTPELERDLFPYYAAGMSINRLFKLKCKDYGFSIGALYMARDQYKWDMRAAEIRNKLIGDQNLELVQKFKNYISFVDDVIGEAMQTFYEGGRNPLAIREMKDLRQAVEIVTHLLHGGVKKSEVTVKEIDDTKAAKILEVLADEGDITDAEIIEKKDE